MGRIFSTDGQYEWMSTHASVPVVGQINGDIVEVYFSTRNSKNESAIAKLKFDLTTLKIVYLSEKPMMTKGELGCFDDSGVMGSSIVKVNNKSWLYYIGWNLGVTVPFRNSIGLAVLSDDKTKFLRKFNGPIVDRTHEEPHFCASNCVIREGNIFKMWYLSCTGWNKLTDGTIRHYYHIKYAESHNGVDWDRRGAVAIDYSSDDEYAISVPRVLRENGKYKMWFSSRASKSSTEYEIRYAESVDGIEWNRGVSQPLFLGLTSIWDSKMMCYPFVFDVGEDRYMLYNGNGYGLTGFGLAKLKVN